jgi:hypothetical protein
MILKFSEMRIPAFLVLFIFFMSNVSCQKPKSILTPWYPEFNDKKNPVLAVYESRIPCLDCERIKMALVIYGHPATHQPTTYMMARIYVGKNNDRVINSGEINIDKGTALDENHTVYRLKTGAPSEYQSFWLVTRDILFILDDAFMPKAGDAGQGYVLNRTK